MIKTKEITIIREKVSSVICDRCGAIYNTEDENIATEIEINEMLHLHYVGEYGSVFGDGTEVECDLCQHCVKHLLGPFIRTRENYDSGIIA